MDIQIRHIPEYQVVKELEESLGYPLYVVGGCPRDLLRGSQYNDVDIASDHPLTDAERHTILNHGFFVAQCQGDPLGRYMAIKDGLRLEVVPKHVYVRDLADQLFLHGDGVEIEDDLRERDFTVNSIATTTSGHILDPMGGVESLAKKEIKANNRLKTFTDDGARMVRAARLASQLGFTIERDTLDIISTAEVLEAYRRTRTDRKQTEFLRLLTKTSDPHLLWRGLRYLIDWGCMGVWDENAAQLTLVPEDEIPPMYPTPRERVTMMFRRTRYEVLESFLSETLGLE